MAGHSAGSHLCAMALCSDWFRGLTSRERNLFKGVVHLSGVFDLKPLVTTSVNEPLKMNMDEAEALSPISQVANLASNLSEHLTFKTLILVAENDSPAFIQQGYCYAKLLEESGVANVSCQTIPMVDHFNLVEKLSMERYVGTVLIRSLVLGE